jgi:hypothetical protein
MKTLLYLLGSVMMCAVAGAQTNPLTPTQDKPARLYMKSCNLKAFDEPWTAWYASGLNWGTWGTDSHNEYQWDVVAGGSGSQSIQANEAGDNYVDGAYSYSASWTSQQTWPGPGRVDGTQTYTESGDQQAYYLFGATSWSTNIGPPSMYPEHCDYSYNFSGSFYGGGYSGSCAQESDQEMILETGGKGKPQQNLWRIGVSAIKYTDPSSQWQGWNGTPEFLFLSQTNVDSGSITVDGKALGNDGNLYEAISDGATRTVTPSVSGADDYIFGVTTQEYDLTITANNNDLSTTTPTFCVGQEVNLQAAWNPSLPNVTQANYNWVSSLLFVNDDLLPVTTDGSYTPYINANLLTNNPTFLWWYMDGYNYIWCKATIQFSNGQTVSMSAEGNNSVFKPKVNFYTGTPATPMLADGSLELGSEAGNGTMTFGAHITSTTDFPGIANWTQLNQRAVTLPFDSTYGQYWLDNGQFYNNGIGAFPPPSPVNPVGSITFGDNPGINDKGIDYESITDKFQTYLMFRPDPQDSSRWVTLGIVNWGWSATQLAWIITSSSVTPPTYTDSNTFPAWLHTAHNSH